MVGDGGEDKEGKNGAEEGMMGRLCLSSLAARPPVAVLGVSTGATHSLPVALCAPPSTANVQPLLTQRVAVPGSRRRGHGASDVLGLNLPPVAQSRPCLFRVTKLGLAGCSVEALTPLLALPSSA